MKEYQPWDMPNFQELGFKVGPSLSRWNCLLLTPITNEGFKPCKTTILDWSWKQPFLAPKRRGTNLEIELLKIKHMSRPKRIYLGFTKLHSKPSFLNVCGFHMSIKVEAPNPNEYPTTIYKVTKILIRIRLGLTYDNAKTNCTMTHALVLSAKMRRNK